MNNQKGHKGITFPATPHPNESRKGGFTPPKPILPKPNQPQK